MRNIKFSGLKGQALVIKDKDIPSIKEFLDVIPDRYFRGNTKTSFSTHVRSLNRDGGRRLNDFGQTLWSDYRRFRLDFLTSNVDRMVP